VGEGPDEIFRTVLDLSDNMPDKADLLYNCGVGFLRSFRNINRREDIDNCILAYGSAVHLTPQGHSDVTGDPSIEYAWSIIFSSLPTRSR
jgi:hypothetical protein